MVDLRSPFRVVELGDHIGDQPAPAGLMRSAKPAAIVAIEIFVEQDVVLEMRIGLQLVGIAEDRAPPVLVAPEDAWSAACASRRRSPSATTSGLNPPGIPP